MALEVGSVFARLEARFDDRGFRAFDTRLERAKRDARDPVTARGRLDVDERSFRQYDDRLERAGRSSKLFGASAAAAAAAGATALAGGLAGVVSAGAGFQRTMSEVRAVTGASEADLDKLAAAARRMGTETGLGAGEAAKAIAELAKGGLTTEQIISGGLSGALALAAAGGLELADAAAGTANALNLFGLEGSKAEHVADAFATAANATTADVGDFALALSQGGAAAKAAGLSFDETVVALEALAANGVKGSDAGTSLKSALTQLANPTKEAAAAAKRLGIDLFDAEGNFVGVQAASRELRDGFDGLTREQKLQAAATIAGTDGMRALLALSDTGPKRLGDFERGLAKQGSAAEVARQKNDNLAGAFRRFRAQAENVAIAIFDRVEPALTAAVNGATKVLGALGRLPAVLRSVAAFFRSGSAAADALAIAGGALAGVLAVLAARFAITRAIALATAAFQAVRNAIIAARIAVLALNLAMRANPIGAVVTVLGALVGALVVAYQRSETFRRIVDGAFRAVRSVAADAVRFIVDRMDDFLGVLQAVASAAGKLPGPLGAPFRAAERGIKSARGELGKLRDGLDRIEGTRNISVRVRYSVTRADGRNAGDSKDDLPTGDPALAEIERALVESSSDYARQREQSAGAGGGAPPRGGTLAIANFLARKFGLRVSSTYRTPAQNAAAGGVPNSSHTRGTPSNPGAIDLVGSGGAMQAASRYAAERLGPIENLIHDAGSGLHLHLAFFRRGGFPEEALGKVGPGAGGVRAFVAGEGSLPEWVISQEGDRRANIGYALDALRTLTGRDVHMHRGGKGRPKRDLSKKAGRAAENRGLTRSVRRADRGFPDFEDAIQNLERTYDLRNRRADLDENDVLVELEDGSVVVDEKAQADRVGELEGLAKVRRQIRDKINAYRLKVNAAVRAYSAAIGRLDGLLKAASGKARKKERGGYRAKRAEYLARRKELRGVSADLNFDRQDAAIDLSELEAELGAARGAKGSAAPAEPADPPPAAGGDGPSSSSGGDTSSTPDTPAETPSSEPAAPTAEQIAEAAAALFAGFQQNRADLFGSFGSNFVVGSPSGDPTSLAAGARYFGATGAGIGAERGTSPVGASGGGDTLGGGVTVVNHFAAPPPDPHTWAAGVGYELKTL